MKTADELFDGSNAHKLDDSAVDPSGYLTVDPVPLGCMEIPGFIVPVHTMDTPAWLTISGEVTRTWSERGVWATLTEVRAAISKYCR